MSEQRRLIFSIVQFLNRELSSNDNSHSEDAKESLEVGAGYTIFSAHRFHFVAPSLHQRSDFYQLLLAFLRGTADLIPSNVSSSCDGRGCIVTDG